MAFTIFSTCLLYFQSVIFHEEHHPVFTWFTQCVTFNFFPSPAHEMAYNLFNVVMLYLLPLLIIIVSYSLLLYRISVKSREGKRPPVQGKELERVYKRCFKVRVGVLCPIQQQGSYLGQYLSIVTCGIRGHTEVTACGAKPANPLVN